MSNTNDRITNMLESLIKSPGRGAERACAVITALHSNKEVPMERLKHFAVGWQSFDDDGDSVIFPVIKMEFYSGEENRCDEP